MLAGTNSCSLGITSWNETTCIWFRNELPKTLFITQEECQNVSKKKRWGSEILYPWLRGPNLEHVDFAGICIMHHKSKETVAQTLYANRFTLKISNNIYIYIHTYPIGEIPPDPICLGRTYSHLTDLPKWCLVRGSYPKLAELFRSIIKFYQLGIEEGWCKLSNDLEFPWDPYIYNNI